MLDQQEAFHAGFAGYMRNWHSKRLGSKHRHKGSTSEDWSWHINGAIAEAMVAKFLRQYWYRVSANQYQFEGDVGNHQVRWTRHQQGHLCVYDADNDSQRYYLVVGEYPNMQIAGWIQGKEAKKPQWFQQDIGCYWVPQEKLEVLDDEF